MALFINHQKLLAYSLVLCNHKQIKCGNLYEVLTSFCVLGDLETINDSYSLDF